MKKTKKLLVFVPLLGLFLSGCSFQEVKHSIGESWIGQHILHPVYDPIRDLFNGDKKEEKGEEGGGEQQQATLESISVSGTFKQEYSIGEELDTTGVVVTATYSDGSTKDVSAQANFSGFSSETKGTCTVTVTFEGKTAEFTCTIDKTAWSAEEKALFDTYLYGFELPFFDAPGFSLKYDSGWVTGEGCTLTAEELLAYEALFSESAGYEDITLEYEEVTDGSFKAFRHSVSTQQGTRYIDILVYTYTDNAYTLGGQFTVTAADTYTYEFPDMNAVFEKYPLLTKFSIPTLELPDGGYYYSQEGSSNATAYNLGYYEYMTFMVWGYNANQESFAAFQAKFANWEVTESEGVYTAKLMVDETHYAEVSFTYDSSSKIIKYNIMLALSEVQFWPTDVAAEIVESVAPGSATVIPAIEGANSYQKYGSFEIDVYGPSTLMDDYVAILTEALWTADQLVENSYISPAQDVSVTLSYATNYGCLEISITKYTAPSAEWPTDDVAALFPEGTTDVLPPFEGTADAYQTYSDAYGTGVLVFVGEENQDAAMEAYASTLLEANFTVSEKKEGSYESPNKEYYVEIYKGTDGAIGLELSMVPYFPSADLEEAISTLVPDAHSHFPAMEEAEKYTLSVATDNSKIRLVMDFGSSTLGPTKTSEYIDLLLKNDFEFAGTDSYGDPMYQSTKYEYYVNVYTNYSSVVLDIYPGIFVPADPGLPVDDCMEILLNYYPELQDTIPGYDIDRSFDVDDSGYYATIELALGCETSAEASAHVAAYESILLEAEYSVGKSGSYGGTVYFSPNQEIAVYPYVFGGTFYIDIDLMVS